MAEPAIAGEDVGQQRGGAPDEPAATDPTHRAEDLWRLFEQAHVRTQARIVDYAERAEARGAVARRSRITALSLFSLGALAPVLAGRIAGLGDRWATGPAPKFLETVWGMPATFAGTAICFFLWALAGGLALFDHRFGASRSWMRDRQTQARLEALAVSLRYAWVARLAKSKGDISDAATVKDLADLISTHVTAREALTEAQTGAWVEQVRTQLAAFDETLTSAEAAGLAQPRA
jgi:hypothetical protein